MVFIPILYRLKSGRFVNRYTIFEKKEYYWIRKLNKNLTINQRKYAERRLKELYDLTLNKTAVGKNFVGIDKNLTGHLNNPNKVRYGVCSRVRNDGRINLNLFMPLNYKEIEKGHQMKISAQNGSIPEHAVEVKSQRIDIDSLALDIGFNNPKSRVLTKEELKKLKKLSKY